MYLCAKRNITTPLTLLQLLIWHKINELTAKLNPN